MEHSQKEFIIEQLRCAKSMIKSSVSPECLHLLKGIHHLNMDSSVMLLRKESLPPTENEVVVKISDDYDQTLREYLIGLLVINPLSKITPCFVHTLGALKQSSPTNTTCIVYDKIPGNTLGFLLNEGLSFSMWLQLFIQILISLEVAQRRTGFTHYDLHAENVVVRDGNCDSYSIQLDSVSYIVDNPALVPVLVDFGTSSTSLGGRYIGAYNYTNSGIFHFIVAGHDMYKLLVSSYCHAVKSSTRREILRLFDFFGCVDPYNISTGAGRSGVLKAQKEFCKDILFSEVASYTPMMMIKYIYSNYRSILCPFVTLVPRTTRSSLLQLDGSEDYTCALQSARHMIDDKSNYLMCEYLLYISEKSSNLFIKNEVCELRKILEDSRSNKVGLDLIMLNECFRIELPSQEKLNKTRANLLEIPIRYINASVKEQCFDRLEEIIDYQYRLEPFLDMYYTILELELKDDYSNWVSEFLKSRIYKFYIANKIENDRACRWGETLLASIFWS